jgi:hypothetical protein
MLSLTTDQVFTGQREFRASGRQTGSYSSAASKGIVSIGEKSPFHSLTLAAGEQRAQACDNAWLRQSGPETALIAFWREVEFNCYRTINGNAIL